MVRVIVPAILVASLAVPATPGQAIVRRGFLMDCLILQVDPTVAEDAGEIDTPHKTSR